MRDIDRLAYWEKRFKSAIEKKGIILYSFTLKDEITTISEKINVLKEMVKVIGYMDKKHSKNFTDITNEIR